jgi:hypothetical protein
VSDGTLVWPRQVASIVAASVCSSPIKTRDAFFEFIQDAYGIRDEDDNPVGDLTLIDASPPTSCVYSQVTGVDKALNFVCDLVSDVGETVQVMGYDENGNWIRSFVGGLWVDGEQIVLAQSPGTFSTHIFSSVTDMQFANVRDGQTWLYECDFVLHTGQRLIGKYEYDELHPAYRVSKLPALYNQTNDVTVEVIAKLEFMPVRVDSDYLLIGNLAALKDMCVAIKNAESEPVMENKAKALAAGLMLAKASLNAELGHYLGRPEQIFAVQGVGGPTGEPLENLL